MFTEARCVVSGKVQGVGYRDFVARAAREHELTGWIQNKQDGTVEVVAQGVPDTLKQFVEELNVGSVLAKVEGVSIDWRTPSKHFTDFQVLF